MQYREIRDAQARRWMLSGTGPKFHILSVFKVKSLSRSLHIHWAGKVQIYLL